MAFISHYNSTKNTVWIGSVKIPPGETRPVDPRFLVTEKTTKTEDNDASFFGDLNAPQVIEKIKTLDQRQLQQALEEEKTSKNRKGVVEAIQKSLLAFASTGNDRKEELEAFSSHWSNQSSSAVKEYLESGEVSEDDELIGILNAILDDQDD